MSGFNILLVTQYVPHYRIPIYNMIHSEIGLTVFHSQNNLDSSMCKFNEIYTDLGSIGPFFYFKTSLRKVCKKFDVVISESNIRFIDRNILTLTPWKRYKWILWGIGQAASYNKKMNDRDIFKYIRLFLQKQSDASILYSSYPLKSYIKVGIDPETIFIANNTVKLSYVSTPSLCKNSILFIGTLYKQKKLEELIFAYKKAIEKCNLNIPLIIIGDGDERIELEKYVSKLGLKNYINFLGNIENHNILSKYFSKALVCISPGQAGLSVLTSMANSVPYITQKDAITGGEVFNIESEINGVVYDSSNDLIEILCDISNNKDKYINMGLAARNYYENSRSPEKMVDSILDAISYVLNEKNK